MSFIYETFNESWTHNTHVWQIIKSPTAVKNNPNWQDIFHLIKIRQLIIYNVDDLIRSLSALIIVLVCVANKMNRGV